ncbi:methylated-DNA--[protein]-cysteine S-methyltransferase [Tritonibacter multivorans]|nr:bifunctional helix-turn-helix domain-containing protein/methylated-DNA--[protein]-cysteine S-methyltransferase [Tritonibacter multivorans]MDA7422599.1 bifunctional helix-turn-helix domain-containing protein/methylated-DNA--[protein]-cysteine S-methyltransferase [Tritonibacter multivorans]
MTADLAIDLSTTSPAEEGGYHYGVMRRAIEVIDAASAAHGGDLPLDALAAQMGMSPAHFQRLFSAWVGVSPKRYQQYLRLGHAKALLADKEPVLATAHAVGLSGSGRLHDLFLRWEAMSPGEYARKGDGLTIRQGWFDSPFGPLLAMGTERGLCGLAFGAETGRAATLADMQSRWPKAVFVDDTAALTPWVQAALTRTGEAALHLMGTPLQIKVWEALLQIPEGAVSTYGEIAGLAGVPTAVRAVGTAVGKNPISWLIPCHRVLRKGGAAASVLGGYHWGVPVKRAMLAYEAARIEGPETPEAGLSLWENAQ